MTFKVEGGELVIARILHGGMIDQQGLLHVGDIIKEVCCFFLFSLFFVFLSFIFNYPLIYWFMVEPCIFSSIG